MNYVAPVVKLNACYSTPNPVLPYWHDSNVSGIEMSAFFENVKLSFSERMSNKKKKYNSQVK